MLQTILGYVFFGSIAILLAGVLVLPIVGEVRRVSAGASFSRLLKFGALLTIAVALLVLLASWK